MCNILAAYKPRATREILPRVPVSLHNLEQFFILFHTLPLHDSHLNTGLLIAKIQGNLARNKANKMIDKIQPYNPIELDAKQVYSRRVGQELIIEEVDKDDPIELDAKLGILGEWVKNLLSRRLMRMIPLR